MLPRGLCLRKHMCLTLACFVRWSFTFMVGEGISRILLLEADRETGCLIDRIWLELSRFGQSCVNLSEIMVGCDILGPIPGSLPTLLLKSKSVGCLAMSNYPYVFDWENAIALHAMQGNRASSRGEGEVSWVFSSCGRHVGYILELRRGCPF